MGSTRGRGCYGVALVGLLGALSLPGLPALSTPGGTAPAPSPATPTAAQWRAMGHFSTKSGRLPSGCHRHYYRYRVSPPSSEWDLETFLYGPRGGRLGSDVIVSGADGTSGQKFFTICSSNTRPGTFTIRGKLTYETYPNEPSGWVTPRRFQLKKR